MQNNDDPIMVVQLELVPGTISPLQILADLPRYARRAKTSSGSFPLFTRMWRILKPKVIHIDRLSSADIIIAYT